MGIGMQPQERQLSEGAAVHNAARHRLSRTVGYWEDGELQSTVEVFRKMLEQFLQEYSIL